MPIPPPDFGSLFTAGTTFTDSVVEPGLARISVENIGMLHLPSGQVYACDPLIGLYSAEAVPFTETIAPGRYPVQVARAEWTDTAERRVAAARVLVRDEPAVSWELALCPGQDPAGLGPAEMFCYGVDTASGCFADPTAVPVFEALNENGDEGPVWDALEDAGHAAVGTIVTDPDAGSTIAVFNTGWGDGGYPTWIGRTTAGEIAYFATEFFVVPDDRDSED